MGLSKGSKGGVKGPTCSLEPWEGEEWRDNAILVPLTATQLLLPRFGVIY